jgi:O-antigen/teichoic acid export membrane protein
MAHCSPVELLLARVKLRIFRPNAGDQSNEESVEPMSRAGLIWMTYAYGVGFMVQALYFVVLARLLGPSGLGRFAATLALVDILAPFSGLGSGNVLVMKTARARASYSAQFGTSLVYIAISAIVLGGVLSAVAAIAPEIGSYLVPIIISELLFGRIIDLSIQSFQAHDRLHGSAHINVGAAVARLCAVGVLFAVSGRPSSVALWSWLYCASSGIAALSSYVWARVAFGGPILDRPSLEGTWRIGIPFSLGTASKTVYVDIDKLMLARIANNNVAGVYTAAYRFVSMAFTPLQALVYSSNTRLFRAGAEGPGAVWRLVRHLVWWVLAGGLLAGLVLFATSPLLTVVLGQPYRECASVVRWLALMPLVQGFHYLIGDSLMGLGRQWIRSLFQLATAGLNVSLNLILIPTFSWRGSVVATYCGEGLLVVAVLVTLLRLVHAEDRSKAFRPDLNSRSTDRI